MKLPARPPSHRAARTVPLWIWIAAAALAAAGIAVLVPARVAPTPASAAGASDSAVARYSYRIVNVYPHDPKAFTQGLLYHDGFLYESTGLQGQSSLRKVRLETGEVLQQQPVDMRHFAEGLALANGALVQLTWTSGVGFVYDLDTFKLLRTFAYPGEGWGLALDESRLVMSDGSPVLRFLDPATFAETGRIEVTEEGRSVANLNELEMVKGEIFANIWQSDDVAIVAPATGKVVGRIDLRGLLSREDRTGPVDVLNGIAYDASGDRLFVTGKLWPKVFEIQILR